MRGLGFFCFFFCRFCLTVRWTSAQICIESRLFVYGVRVCALSIVLHLCCRRPLVIFSSVVFCFLLLLRFLLLLLYRKPSLTHNIHFFPTNRASNNENTHRIWADDAYDQPAGYINIYRMFVCCVFDICYRSLPHNVDECMVFVLCHSKCRCPASYSSSAFTRRNFHHQIYVYGHNHRVKIEIYARTNNRRHTKFARRHTPCISSSHLKFT